MKKLNGFGPDTTPRGIAAKKFSDYIEKESNGRIKIESHSMETYGTESQMIDAVKTGKLDLQVVGANILASTIPPFAALSLPFLTRNIKEGYAVLDGPVGNRLKELGEEHGLKVLTDVALGYAQITNNVRPIHHPADLLGVKMRAPNEASFIETFKKLGAPVITMGYTEVYSALDQGVIDGQFNPLSNIFDLHLDDVQDYIALTNHAYYVAFIIMNKNVFDNLDSELQHIVVEAGKVGRDAARKYVVEKEEELKKKANTAFKEITSPEMEPFQKATQEVYVKMEEVMGGEIIKDIQEFLRDYRIKREIVEHGAFRSHL